MSGIKGKSGRKPNIKKDLKVLELKEKGLSFREISKVIKDDVSNTHRRYVRALSVNKN